MKVKLTVLTLLCSLINNVTSAGDLSGGVDVGYVSDYFYRGGLVSTESVQTKISAETSLSDKIGFGASAFANSPLAGSEDTYEITACVHSLFLDELLTLTGGYSHREQSAGASLGELFIGAGINTKLSPSVVIARSTQDDLYSVEIGVGHTFETELADVTLDLGVGTTEITSSTDRDYWLAGLTASRTIKGGLDGNVGVQYIDADNTDGETVVSLGLVYKF